MWTAPENWKSRLPQGQVLEQPYRGIIDNDDLHQYIVEQVSTLERKWHPIGAVADRAILKACGGVFGIGRLVSPGTLLSAAIRCNLDWPELSPKERQQLDFFVQIRKFGPMTLPSHPVPSDSDADTLKALHKLTLILFRTTISSAFQAYSDVCHGASKEILRLCPTRYGECGSDLSVGRGLFTQEVRISNGLRRLYKTSDVMDGVLREFFELIRMK